MKYTSINVILTKFYRETKDSDISENDIIEWIGEALDFCKVYETQEQAVAFQEVKDYQAPLPKGFQSLLQIARDTQWSPCPENSTDSTNTCCCDIQEEIITECSIPENVPVPLDCNGTPVTEYELAYYRPYFDLRYEYEGWTNSKHYTQRYVPVRLSNHTFFNTVVCKEKDDAIYKNYDSYDEYTIIGNEDALRFSFKEGYVAIAYLKTALDEEGLPLIPDNVSLISAITYYIKWKIGERHLYSNREGSVNAVQYNEDKWLKYCRQAKNFFKMPKSIDDYQDILELSHQMIPRKRRAYSFFGNLANLENRKFNNPHQRRNNYYGD